MNDPKFAQYVKDKKRLNKKIMAKKLKDDNAFAFKMKNSTKNLPFEREREGSDEDSFLDEIQNKGFEKKGAISKRIIRSANGSSNNNPKALRKSSFKKQSLLVVKKYLLSTSEIKNTIIDYSKVIRNVFPNISLKEKVFNNNESRRIMDIVLPLENTVYNESIDQRNLYSHFASMMKYKEITYLQREDKIVNIYLKEKNPYDFMVSDYVKNTEYSIKWLKNQNKFDAFQLSHY